MPTGLRVRFKRLVRSIAPAARLCVLLALALGVGQLWLWGQAGSTSPTAVNKPAPLPPSLRQAYQQFLRLSPEQQQRLLALDQALREEDTATQARLLRLMVRYAEWLDRLPHEERAWIEQADTEHQKLERIRAVKERQWIRTLPRPDQEALAQARQRSEAEYRQLLEQLRDRDKQLDLEWNLAAPPSENQEWVRPVIARWFKQLRPYLSPQEQQLLAEVQKRNRPLYLYLLAELSEKHHVPVPADLHRSRLIYPPVPQTRLWQFLRNELDASTRQEFERRFRDPAERDLALADLVRAYWQAHPQELHQLHEREIRRLHDKPKPNK